MFQEIDGDALLLLKSEMMMKYLGLKLGPALKLCYHIDRLKQNRLWFAAEEPNIQTPPWKTVAVQTLSVLTNHQQYFTSSLWIHIAHLLTFRVSAPHFFVSVYCWRHDFISIVVYWVSEWLLIVNSIHSAVCTQLTVICADLDTQHLWRLPETGCLTKCLVLYLIITHTL